MLRVRPAVESDLKLILYLIDEAADWLRAKGINQWNAPWPNEIERDARVKRGLEVYVSRLVVSRSYAGAGVGAELVNWVGMWARKQYGARWIRIDVWTTNIALHSYYQKEGFRFLRFCDDVDYPSAALFQRSTDDIRSTDVPRLEEKPKLIKPDKPVRLVVRRPGQWWRQFSRAGQDSSQRVFMAPEEIDPCTQSRPKPTQAIQ